MSHEEQADLWRYIYIARVVEYGQSDPRTMSAFESWKTQRWLTSYRPRIRRG